MQEHKPQHRIKLGIRLRLTLVFLACFGVMAVISVLQLRASLLPRFSTLEQRAMSDDMARLIEAFSAELSDLELLTRDWSRWNDLHDFAEHHSKDFLVNVQPASLRNNATSVLAIFDRQGERLAYLSVAPGTDRPRHLDVFADEGPALRAHVLASSSPTPRCGLLQARDVMLMVCWTSILRSDGGGTPAGTLVMARDLDTLRVRRIGERTRMAFELRPAAPDLQGAEAWPFTPPQFMQAKTIHAKRLDTHIRLAYFLTDVLGRPLATIGMTAPRSLMESGRMLVASTAAQLGLIALSTGLVLFAAIQVMFARPLAQLRRSVGAIRQDKTWSERMQVTRSDEIGQLGEEINGLLGVIDTQMIELEALSRTDPLTGIANRRAFDPRLAHELQHAARSGKPVSMLMMDIDFFKQYNDSHGHPAGDRVIQELAQVVTSVTRRGIDLGARLGGEEFAALLPDTDAIGARRVAQALQDELARRALPHNNSAVGPCVTVSIGIATSSGGSPSELVERADLALYQAKKQGRNRIAAAPDPGAG